MSFMDELIEKADRKRKASRTKLTPTECKALRLAIIFGRPPEGHPDLDSARAKLRVIEAGG